MKRTLSLLLLMPCALNAMLRIQERDIGAEKSYRELSVRSTVTRAPYGSHLAGIISMNGINRYYTQSGARLHDNEASDACTIASGDHEVSLAFINGYPLRKQRTQVVVDYQLNQHTLLPNSLTPPFWCPVPVTSETLHLPLDGSQKLIEHTTPNNELIAIALIAKWIEHKASDADKKMNKIQNSNDDNE